MGMGDGRGGLAQGMHEDVAELLKERGPRPECW